MLYSTSFSQIITAIYNQTYNQSLYLVFATRRSGPLAPSYLVHVEPNKFGGLQPYEYTGFNADTNLPSNCLHCCICPNCICTGCTFTSCICTGCMCTVCICIGYIYTYCILPVVFVLVVCVPFVFVLEYICINCTSIS